MYNYIISHLPYKSSFLFVDHITSLNENGITGDYTLNANSFFYEDHFAGNPVTPGAILSEIMAQIGLVALGVFLLLNEKDGEHAGLAGSAYPLLTSTESSFFKMVLPGQKVTVISEKVYFRFNKLKCSVKMFDEDSELIAKGIFSGIIKDQLMNNGQDE